LPFAAKNPDGTEPSGFLTIILMPPEQRKNNVPADKIAHKW
jgi:hypothetical protein